MKKRILSILLAALMIAALLPSAALATGPSTPTVDGKTVYANGCPLIIEGLNNNARIYIDTQANGIADAGDKRFFLNGTTAAWGSVDDSNNAGDDLTLCTFYGGYQYTAFEEVNSNEVNTSITLTGGSINAIYGGSKYGTIVGNTSVKITGGAVKDVYGGSDNTLAHNGVTGNISIQMTGGTVSNNLVGGGKDSTVEGDISILVTGGTVKGDIYGGGHITTSPTTPYTAVKGNTSVVLGEESGNKQIEVKGNVFGGGKNASVDGAASVTLYSNSNKVSAANVFGGGCGVSALVTGSTEVQSGAVIRVKENGGTYTYGGVYGGGYYDINSSDYNDATIYPTVGAAAVTITGGIMQDVKVSGVCMNTSGADLNAALTAESGAISIQGGTIRGNADATTYVNDTTTVGSGVCTITGGSIRGTVTAKNITNGSEPVYRTEATLPGVTEEVLVDYSLELAFLNDLENEHTYKIIGIYPNEFGKLWFYLPVCTAVASYEGAKLVANVSAASDPNNIFEQFIIDTTNSVIYANMNPIKLVDGTESGKTNILYDADGDGGIEETEMLKIGTDAPTAAGYDLKGYTVYLGFKNFEGEYDTELTMDGGVVKDIKLNGTGANDVTKYGVEAVVNNGTVLNELNLGYAPEDTGVKTLKINGGSISSLTNCPTPKDKNGNTLYASTLKLPNITTVTGVSDKLTLKKGAGETASAATYGTTGLYTTTAGLLTFWLPADIVEEVPVKTTYTATYDTEPVYTAYVNSNDRAFRQTSDALTVLSDRVVKASAEAANATYTVTNDPMPTLISEFKVYTYDEAYIPSAVTATLSGTELTLTATPSGAITAGTYYVTVTVNDAAGTQKWESDYLKLTVADPTPEVVTTESGSTLYTNTLNVKITADAKGTYACVDIDNDNEFEETEFVMAGNGTDKLDITGFDIDASGKTATVTAGTIGTLTANTAVIDGGSVKEIYATTIQKTAGTPVYKATITLYRISGKTKISASDANDYDVTGVYTDGGKLYFWLPVDTKIKSVTVSSTYTGTLTVTNDNAAAETFTASSGGGGGGGGSTVTKTYTVTTGDGVSTDMKKAKEGDTVTLTLAEGYVLTVGTESGKTVAVSGDGMSFTFVMPAENVTVTAEKKEEEPAEDPAKGFTDLDDDAWYMDAVRFCLENGYMNGISETKFDPDGDTTRAQFVTVLWRWCGSPAASKAGAFTDVARNEWYTDAIDWAAQNGIVNGIGDGKFGTADPITREQIAAILYRLSGSIDITGEETGRTLTDFTDTASISAYAREGMQFCVSKGIFNGADGALLPLNKTSRVQFAQIIYNISDHAE